MDRGGETIEGERNDSVEAGYSYAINPNAPLDQVLVRTAPNGTKTFYIYGIGLLYEESGTNVRYYHMDRRGDTVALTDADGTVTDRASYGPYGEVVSRSGTTDTPFLFNGLYGVQTDANGLCFMRARYYHPTLRRFLNQDTVLGSIIVAASLNRYAYANGNPVSMVDPFGMMAEDVAPSYYFREFWDTDTSGGGLVFDNDKVRDAWRMAREYLIQDPVAKALIEYIESGDGGRIVKIYEGVERQQTMTGYDSDPSVIAIQWNVLMGLRFDDARGGEGSLSPAMALLHELAHAEGLLRGTSRQIGWLDIKTNDVLLRLYKIGLSSWDSLEEKRVILGVERLAASGLGEGLRSSHEGTPYYTTGPVSRFYLGTFPGFGSAPLRSPKDVKP